MKVKKDSRYNAICPECEGRLKCNLVLEFYNCDVKYKNRKFQADLPKADSGHESAAYIAQVYCPNCHTIVAHESEANQVM